MKKLTPKGIIGLSTTSFLFLILMSIIYLNNQVEFNTVEAKWELKQDYQIGETIEVITGEYTTPEYINEEYWTQITGTIDDFEDLHRTNKIEIIGNSITLSQMTFTIHFWNESIYIGYYTTSDAGGAWETNSLGTFSSIFNNGDIIIPNNATHFALNGLIDGYQEFDGNYIRTTFTQFQNIIIEYTTDNYNNIDSYQVFENIRNNATTVNPLGFMNTLVSIPARAIGYYNSLVGFVTGGLGLNFRDMTFSELGDNWWVKLDTFISKFNNPEIYGDPWDRWRD